MDHIASLVNNDIGKEILELWQVSELHLKLVYP